MIQYYNLSSIAVRKRREKKVRDDWLTWNVIDLVGTGVQYHGRGGSGTVIRWASLVR